ncbi:MAG: DinB family protein [Acidobacteriota bacterium]|nr:DinB family protein [Acidobacteriota bacterium]
MQTPRFGAFPFSHLLQRRGLAALLAIALLATLFTAPAFAHGDKDAKDHDHDHDHAEMAAKEAMAGGEAAKAALLRNWEGVNKKLVDLAEAIPAEHYGWRPMEGVRSVSETFMHVAGANYFLSSPFGTEMPEGVRELEQITDKAKVVETLQDSIDKAGAALKDLDVSRGAEELNLFGRTMTRNDVVLILLSHAHEHLGQAIAYARSNEIVPPWSRPQPADDGADDSGDDDSGR